MLHTKNIVQTVNRYKDRMFQNEVQAAAAKANTNHRLTCFIIVNTILPFLKENIYEKYTVFSSYYIGKLVLNRGKKTQTSKSL